MCSPAGNRTRVFRVTGGDTDHYTTEESTVIHFASFPKGPLVVIRGWVLILGLLNILNLYTLQGLPDSEH